MGIKLKDNKTISFLMIFVLISAAVICFCVQYPVFERNARRYQVDILQDEEFLTNVYQGNIVLYRELAERVSGKSVKYRDLFLHVSEMPDERADNRSYLGLGGKTWNEVAGEIMDVLLEEWESEVRGDNGIAREADYCVTDHASKMCISNTGNPVIKLGTDEADEELKARYPYYIKMSFNDVGYLEHVSVKGENSEELLKTVQNSMRRRLLSDWFDRRCPYSYDEDRVVYYYNSLNEGMRAEMEIFDSPKGCTICYAFTKEQMETMVTNNSWRKWMAYYSHSGVSSSFHGLLCMLAVPALLLPFWKRYPLHHLRLAKVPFEAAAAGVICCLSYGGVYMTDLVMGVNGGSLADMIRNIFGFLPAYQADRMAHVAAWVVNLALVYLAFGLWFYLLTSFGQVRELGMVGYFKERSLIFCWSGRFVRNLKRKYGQFEEQILHVDLGEKENKTVFRVVAVNFVILACICFMWMFGWMALVIYSVVVYLMIRKYMKKIKDQYQNLLEATESIAGGNLQTKFDKDWGVFESYKEELIKIQDGFSKAVAEEVKSQKMKTELITNVSHDLKTPLTAIMTYIELLKEENLSGSQKEYLDVLEKKALRLKTLIEDLFEVSKVSNGNVTLNLQEVDIGNLMRQAYLEYEDKVEDADLIFRFRMPEEKVVLNLDSQKTYRIFENLYTNIIKYAMPHTRVYVDVERTEKDIVIELKNISKVELNIPPESLTERFVRGDSSRNTEGSGLGLAIAQNFVELQKGKMKVDIDGDLFKVTLSWLAG